MPRQPGRLTLALALIAAVLAAQGCPPQPRQGPLPKEVSYEPVGDFGSDGLVTGFDYLPLAVKVRDGRVYVVDSAADLDDKVPPSLKVFDADTGRLVAGRPIKSGLDGPRRPRALDVDGRGNAYLTFDVPGLDSRGGVEIVAPDGSRTTLYLGLADPCAVAADEAGLVYVVERASARVLRIDPADPTRSVTVAAGDEIGLDRPSAVEAGDDGTITVVDNPEPASSAAGRVGRVTKIGPEGQILVRFRGPHVAGPDGRLTGAISVDALGHWYLAAGDTFGIRAGDGTFRYLSTDDAAVRDMKLENVLGVDADPDYNLYVVDASKRALVKFRLAAPPKQTGERTDPDTTAPRP